MTCDFVFDQPHARRFVEARRAMLQLPLVDFREKLGIKSVADAGCGIGYFSSFLQSLGFKVVGFDGRAGNIDEARRRHPDIRFDVANVEEPILHMGVFDLVFCVGLLYHLENPLRALRNLAAITDKVLLIESYSTPQAETVLYLREEPHHEDQSLTYLALYPSESSLIKLCYRIGFSSVYRFSPLPDHEDFRDRRGRKRQRTMLIASRLSPLEFPYLWPVAEPRDFSDPWQTVGGQIVAPLRRLNQWVLRHPRLLPWRAVSRMTRHSDYPQ